VTEAQIAEAVQLVKPDDDDQDILRQIVGKSLVQWKLKQLSDKDPGSSQFGFTVSTSTQDDITARAEELRMELTDSAWNQINADLYRLERNACNILRENNIQCQPEGHSDDDLSGSAWMKADSDPTQTHFLPSKKALTLMLKAKDSSLNSYDGSIEDFDPNKTLWNDVSDLGRRLIDVSISFFNTDELNLDDWEEVLEANPEVWGTINEAKEYLDFNTLLGPPVENRVHVKNVNGVPIFSVRCPGCKRIHGNFRTFDEASSNQQCKYCTRDYVDMMLKANETGKYKHLLKKHDKRRSK
jgi:hypothetical protein